MDRELKELKIAGYIFLYPAKYKGKEYRKLLSIVTKHSKFENGVYKDMDISGLLDDFVDLAKIIFIRVEKDGAEIGLEVIDELEIEEFNKVSNFVFDCVTSLVSQTDNKKKES